jgi:hypothetical protein
MTQNWPATPDVNIQIDCRALFKKEKKIPSPKKEVKATKVGTGSDEVFFFATGNFEIRKIFEFLLIYL